MNDDLQQQAKRIYKNMPLLALDLLSRIEAIRVDRGPLFLRSSRFDCRRWRLWDLLHVLLAASYVKLVMDALQRAVVAP
jgi:hypothetical protein